ncbi:MAG: hypothetical protein HY826_00320 [Actinobacteria bacterium]|nr:hypothetical protein [Actinomycetota bacterium]
MRFRFAVLVAVTSVLTVVSPATAGHPATIANSAVDDWSQLDRLLFRISLPAFLKARAGGDPRFDWSTDNCSAPLIGDTGRSFNFRDPCRRHDFGYRNLQLMERRYAGAGAYWNATNRRRVDEMFLADMRTHCRSRSLPLRPTCQVWAETFFRAVRIAGGP